MRLDPWRLRRWMAGVACLAALLASSQATSAADGAWPMFRGAPDLRGLADGTLTPPLRLLWTAKTGGPVKSSVAIQQSRVFVGSDDGKLHAFSLTDGKEIWSTELGGPIESSPLVLGDLVCVGSSDGNLYAVASGSGEVRWKYATGDRILGAPNAGRLPGDAGQIIVVGSYDCKMHAVDAATGAARWTFDTGNFVNGAAAISEGRVIFGGCDGKLHVLQLTNGQPIGEIEVGAYVAGSCAVHGNMAWVGHFGNEVACADLSTAQVRWVYRAAQEPFYSSPAVDATRVVIGGRDGQLYCLGRQSGQRLWTFKAKGIIDSSPVICGSAVVFGSEDGRLYLVNLADGQLLWSYEIGKPIDASPAVAGGIVVIGANDGVIYAFRSAGRLN
jgi:outer membrane protein assembly factor BamB